MSSLAGFGELECLTVGSDSALGMEVDMVLNSNFFKKRWFLSVILPNLSTLIQYWWSGRTVITLPIMFYQQLSWFCLTTKKCGRYGYSPSSVCKYNTLIHVSMKISLALHLSNLKQGRWFPLVHETKTFLTLFFRFFGENKVKEAIHSDYLVNTHISISIKNSNNFIMEFSIILNEINYYDNKFNVYTFAWLIEWL